MNQVSEEDTADSADLSRLAVVVNTLAVADSGSPLARALRRRRREIDQPMPVAAGHDSVI